MARKKKEKASGPAITSPNGKRQTSDNERLNRPENPPPF
jgi:hypothetical protein